MELSVRLRNLIKLGIAVRKLNNRAAHLTSEVAAATQKLQQREEEIILHLALAVEYRDNNTGEHTLRVVKYSRIIAEELCLPPRLCRDIYLAAPLHDVGKVAIPDSVLLKPGRLNDDEMAIIRTHAAIGGRILADSHCELIQLAATIASTHHERWDGSDYPNGLTGLEIPICAHIVMVANVFDALTTKRPAGHCYRPPHGFCSSGRRATFPSVGTGCRAFYEYRTTRKILALPHCKGGCFPRKRHPPA